MSRKSKVKYEIIEVENTEVTVDVSLLAKTEELFFNATQMSKSFGKRPNDFWQDSQNCKYLEALITITGCNKNSFIQTKRGKYGGTYFHKDLALQFARWLSPAFAVNLDRWTVERLKEEKLKQRERLEAKTGYLPMTNAIQQNHDPIKGYHFSNEADMLNVIVFGMKSKKYKEIYHVDNVRDNTTAAELRILEKLQMINTGLIEIGMLYQERKEKLQTYYEKSQDVRRLS